MRAQRVPTREATSGRRDASFGITTFARPRALVFSRQIQFRASRIYQDRASLAESRGSLGVSLHQRITSAVRINFRNV